jgi:hypothetical protein
VESNEHVLRRSQRNKRLVIPNDYEIYMSEGINVEGDSTSFEEDMNSADSSKWLKLEDKMKLLLPLYNFIGYSPLALT